MYGKIQQHLQNELNTIQENGLFKKERIITSPQGAEITISTGETVLNFCASTLITPKGADQIQLQLHVAKLDFEHFTTPITQTSSMTLINLNDATTYDLVLSYTPTLQDSNIPIAVLEVVFFQEVNGSFIPLKGGGIKIAGVQ